MAGPFDPHALQRQHARKIGHPRGLWVLFITEMWERFSYYGMRALLVLYLISSTKSVLPDGGENANPGFGWSEGSAYLLYGVYTWAVYLTPIFGGWLADRFLGTHRSMLVGGWIIAAGHITLALTETFHITAGEAVTLQTGPGALLCFLTGLLLIIVGTGFFKPCVSVMVGQLYEQGDPRRDSGFTIFYMGINLGALFSPLVAGTLGERVGWHWGFGCAAVGMLTGLFFYHLFRPKYLAGIGLSPAEERLQSRGEEPAGRSLSASPQDGDGPPPALTREEWQRLAVIVILALLGNIFFWALFEQAGSSLNVFALKNTYRPLWLPEWFRRFCIETGYPASWQLVAAVGGALVVPLLVVVSVPHLRRTRTVVAALLPAVAGGVTVALAALKSAGRLTELGAAQEYPASWYQSVNPFAILVFAPVFSWLWVWLNRRRANPSTPMKFACGLYLIGLGFLAMVLASFEAEGDNLAGPQWLLVTYLVATWGELCLSPVGLSMVTKLAPRRLQSLMMGVWFLSFSMANLLAGLIAWFSKKLEAGEITFVYEGLPGFFLMLVVFPIGAGVTITLLTPLLKRMMHGVE